MSIKAINFSLWCDFIERSFLEQNFVELIDKGIINGATSNPSIFAQSFINSPAYKEQIASLKDKSPKEIYEALALQDIKRAAELLLPLYKAGNDGFISIEIDPFLCHDTMLSVLEGRRLFESIGMPNVMIKVPSTDAGYGVMSELIAEGINVNATLIFSQKQIDSTLAAMKEGFDSCSGALPHTVLSIFVSRFDRKCDKELELKGFSKGELGIMNATLGYHSITKAALPNTKCLFASTGVKGDEYPQSYYIDELLFSNSINTAPLDTIGAYIKNSKKERKEPLLLPQVESYFRELQSTGFDMEKIYDELIDEGIKAFHKSFEELLTSLKG